jgi:hypothetical protein
MEILYTAKERKQWNSSYYTIHGTVNTKVTTKEITEVPLYISIVSTVIVGDNVYNT